MIAIVDYGMGNLRSVEKAFEFLGFDVCVSDQRQVLMDADHIVLPGVGAMADALLNLEKRGLVNELKKQVKNGKPFLGICLGMQLLLKKGYENGEHEAFGLIDGEVKPFETSDLRIPHIGWNLLQISRDNPLFRDEGKPQYVYFVHSYHAEDVNEKDCIAETEYGCVFPSAIQNDNVFGLQFHPEKSGVTGLSMLKNFGGLKL